MAPRKTAIEIEQSPLRKMNSATANRRRWRKTALSLHGIVRSHRLLIGG
jgi:hypothetical protein